MSSDKFFTLFGKLILVFAVIGGIAFASYYWGSQNKLKDETQSLPFRVETEVSATAIPNIAEINLTSIPSTDEASLLKVIIKESLVTKHGSNADFLNVSISQIQGNFASGGATDQGGGGMWFAAKANGAWKLVWDGNGSILCSDLTTYPNLPVSMIPECWNDQTQKLIIR